MYIPQGSVTINDYLMFKEGNNRPTPDNLNLFKSINI